MPPDPDLSALLADLDARVRASRQLARRARATAEKGRHAARRSWDWAQLQALRESLAEQRDALTALRDRWVFEPRNESPRFPPSADADPDESR